MKHVKKPDTVQKIDAELRYQMEDDARFCRLRKEEANPLAGYWCVNSSGREAAGSGAEL